MKILTLITLLALTIFNLVFANPIHLKSLDDVRDGGAIEGVLPDNNIYILSASTHSIPNEGVSRIDGEQIALEIATIKANSYLAEYMEAEFETSNTYNSLSNILNKKVNINEELKKSIIAHTKRVVLRRVQTMGQKKERDYVRVIRGISKSDFINQIE